MKISKPHYSYARGHKIQLYFPDIKVGEEDITLKEYNEKYGIPKWIYCDTQELLDYNRPCNKCGIVIENMAIDACIGKKIDGVLGSCCGHGINSEKYIKVINPENNKTLTLHDDLYDLFMKFKNFNEFKKEFETLNPGKDIEVELKDRFNIKWE